MKKLASTIITNTNQLINSSSLTRRLMIPLSILVSLFTLGAGFLFYQQYNHYLHDTMLNNTTQIINEMEILVQEQTSGLELAITPIANNPDVIKALQQRDSKALLTQWQTLFDTMKQQNKLTHFYFMDQNRVCLLRVHNPPRSGDVIERYTTMDAQWNRKISSGIEVGPMGILTLRVVQPVIIDNKLIGYIELGKEIEDVLEHLHNRPNTHLVMILRKQYLDRTKWEDGMRILNREADWELFKNNVLIYSSLESFPRELLKNAEIHATLSKTNQILEQEVTSQGDSYHISTVPFKDVSGRVIGDLMIIHDNTVEKLEFFDFVVAGSIALFGIITLLVSLMYLLLRRSDKAIMEQQFDLYESQYRLDQLAHHSRTIAWEVNSYGKYTYISDVVSEVLGYTPDEILGKYFYDLHPIEGREEFKVGALKVFEQKVPFSNFKNQAISKSGEIVWLLTNGLPLLSDDGRLLGYRGSDTDITEWQKAEVQINQLAYYDLLTGLPNRTLLNDRLHQAMVLGDRNNEYGAVLMIDLDNFKTLNDTLGHGVGDNLLKQSAERLSNALREGDSVSRLGGDEFVVLLSNLGNSQEHAAQAARLVAEKILLTLNESYQLETLLHHSTASIGITLFRGVDISAHELIKQADLAMYKSKEAGRNRLSFFDPDMENSLLKRTQLESEIRLGIESEAFELYFQPQVQSDGRLCGAEALIRWNHPVRGVVSPVEFIPICEESGLILPLGRWILKRACEQLVFWSTQEHFNDLIIAVNVSARQFSQSDFVEQVETLLNESGANPKKLKLELTESLLVQNIDSVIEKMERLKDIGIRFSLDDFGTGYSSLSYLKRLPLDQLKIDQGFVRDILLDPNDAIICKSTIALAESMGLSVIAEGVEEREQLEMLITFGCKSYQGYWFSRPLNLEAFEIYQENLMDGK